MIRQILMTPIPPAPMVRFAARLGRGTRKLWRMATEPLTWFGWKPPVTATFGWNLTWVAIYACLIVVYCVWTFRINALHERVRSVAALEAQTEPLWRDLNQAYQKALPFDSGVLPLTNPRAELIKMMEKPIISLAFYVSPENVLTIALRPRLPQNSGIDFDEVNLNTWQPSNLLLADSRGPWTQEFGPSRLRTRLREEFIYAFVKSHVTRKPLLESHFQPILLVGRHTAPYMKGSPALGFLGFEIAGFGFTGLAGDDILVHAGLQDALEWNSYVTGRHTSFSARGGLPSAINKTTLTVTAQGLLDANQDINHEAVLVLGLLGLLLLVRLNHATKDLRTLFNESAIALAQSNFVSAVSHEMRTPLTTIRMYAEMLEQDVVTDPARRQHYLRTIAAEGERLGRLVENVLEYASISGRRKAYCFETVDARELLAEALSAVAGPLEAVGLIVEVHAPVPVLASVDRDAVVQSIINLLGNAIKYAATGGRLVVSAMPSGDGGVTLCVEDFGPGIAADEQQNVFKPFYRVGNELTRTATGSGLGLALVAETAKAHQGSVELESIVGRGSLFRMVLPGPEYPHPTRK
jgi:signal transduction histidine kinase